jgi:hypothetical protein
MIPVFTIVKQCAAIPSARGEDPSSLHALKLFESRLRQFLLWLHFRQMSARSLSGGGSRNLHRCLIPYAQHRPFSKVVEPGAIVEDITVYLEMLPASDPDHMVDGLEHVVYTTRHWSFSDPAIFEDRGSFRYLIELASTSSVDPLFRSRALKILANVLDERFPVYFTLLSHYGIVSLIAHNLSDRDRKVVLNIFKLAARFAVSRASAQALLDILTMKPILEALSIYAADLSVANQIHNLIISFLCCDFEPLWDDFLTAILLFIEHTPPENNRLVWILWVLPTMISGPAAAERLLDNATIVAFIAAHFTSDHLTVLENVFLVMARLFEFSNRPVPNIDYPGLLPLIAEGGEDRQEVVIAAASVVANAFVHSTMIDPLCEANAMSL